MERKELINKYIKRIIVDYPEEDKLYLDLAQFADELINSPNESKTVNRNEQAKECFHSLTCTHCGKTFKDMLDAEGHRCRLRKHD